MAYRIGLSSLPRAALFALAALCAGCGSSSPSAPAPATSFASPAAPGAANSYFGTGPAITPPGGTGDIWAAYFDHIASQMYASDQTAGGVQADAYAGGSFASDSGFLNLTLNVVPNGLVGEIGGFVQENPGRIGMLRLGDNTNPLVPLMPTNSCPNLVGTFKFSFVTIPDAAWNSMTDTAFGTVQGTVGSNNWTFANNSQFTLTGTQIFPSITSSTGVCALSTIGSLISLPPAGTVFAPIATATIAVGPSGFLLEDNGSNQGLPIGSSGQPPAPSPLLGAGVGAIGVVQPSGQLNTSDIVGVQYQGWVYEPGASGIPTAEMAAWGPCLAPACPVPPDGTNMLGGIYAADDPTQPPNTDTVIDLGVQDPMLNGVYPAASVTFAGFTSPAVAIIGNPENKFAIFIISQDTLNNIPEAIYLFQR